MTTTSQPFPVSQEKFDLLPSRRGSSIPRIAAALAFIGALALAPVPAFAQHGGGGGGGGGSHGGGGGGGSHGSSGGGGSASAPSGGGEAHANGGSAGSGNAAHSGSGGHWWNPFHSGSATSSAVPAGNIKSESSATSARFAAGNNTWQEPPSASARAAARVNYYGPANVNGSRPFVPLTSTTRAPLTSAHGAAVVAAAEHPFQPVRPGYPYYPYYPYSGYYPYYGALGFGWGGFGPCDPFWGCNGYGFGYGFGGGLGYFGGLGSYGGYSSGYGSGWTDESSEGSGNMTSPDSLNSYLYAAPGTGSAQAEDSANAVPPAPAESAPQQTYVLLYLKDGSSFAVSDYWMTNGKLHYVTSYGGENAVDEGQIDLQRTVNENAARGVDFSLRPERLPPTGEAPTQNPEPQKP
jgi:hypothetical protein